MFAFIGAARAGKTTLAKSVAEVTGFHYHDASISKFAEEIGVNAVGNLTIDERLRVQRHLLHRYCEELAKAPRPAVTDRTPLDMIGYMLGEVTMHNTTAEDGLAIKAYVDQCLKATDLLIDTIIIVRPLPFYDVDPNKPPENRAYQWNTQMIMEGAANQLMYATRATLFSDDLETRTEQSIEVILSRLKTLREESKDRLIC